MTTNMQASRQTTKPQTPKESTAVRFMWHGWNDRKAGLPFREDYERMPYHLQRNYEKGRQLAAITLGKLGKVPKWASNGYLMNLLHRNGIDFYLDVEVFFRKDARPS